MKKNRTTKIAIIVLALVLATSCFVGTTLAKYTTKITGTDSARVAKWGVVLEADTDLFDASYDLNKTGAEISVDAHDDVNVIAPGTTKTATIFTIDGNPEVDVEVLITLDADDALSMVTLPAGTYTDYTVREANAAYPSFTVDADYNPVKWTLKKNGAVVTYNDGTSDITLKDVTLQTVEDYLDFISGTYDVNATANKSDFTSICGTYELSWDWNFVKTTGTTQEKEYINKCDTTLGQIAAGVINPAGLTDYVANETFKLLITVDQVD